MLGSGLDSNATINDHTGDAKFFYLVIKIDPSETTKSHMFSTGTSLRLTSHK